jgi:predicted nucleic acid-binding protein
LGHKRPGAALHPAGKEPAYADCFTEQINYGLVEYEMMSAFCRLLRQDEIGQRDFEAALARLASLKASWIEILPTERVRELAEGLLQTYPLRAADALQLAAALTWTRKQPRKRTFICCDNRLAESALKEGFQAEIL